MKHPAIFTKSLKVAVYVKCIITLVFTYALLETAAKAFPAYSAYKEEIFFGVTLIVTLIGAFKIRTINQIS
jgi:hypothetical protein